MPGSKHRCIVQFIARRMHAHAVAQPHAALRLIEGKVIFYTSLKMRRHRGSVHGKGPSGVGVQPAALILQCLGQVPVVERHIRFNARRQQRVHKLVVPGKARGVHRAGASRENTRPGDGKPVGLQVQGFHQLHILGPAVVAVAGDVAGVAALGLARRMAEGIPDGRPTPVLKRAALYLIGCGSRTPDEMFWKLHFSFPLALAPLCKGSCRRRRLRDCPSCQASRSAPQGHNPPPASREPPLHKGAFKLAANFVGVDVCSDPRVAWRPKRWPPTSTAGPLVRFNAPPGH